MSNELTLKDDDWDDELATPKLMESVTANRLKRAANHLLNLNGDSYVYEQREVISAIANDPELATEEWCKLIDDLLARYEREANLRGEAWTWEETL